MSLEQNRGRLIVVCGATGKQGGAVTRHLLDRGFRVRALTREAQKPAARKLAERGAEVVEANLDERSSLPDALKDAYGVFSVQNFWETGFDREVEQGKNVAEAAKSAGIKHLVYSSVGSANRQTGLPHFESKWKIEKHLLATGVPYTVLRPVFFMENWRTYAGDQIRNGILPQPLDANKPLQQIATDDIGVFAVMALEDPGKWIGRSLDLAGDELTMPQVAEIFSRALGRDVQSMQVPWDQFEKVVGEETTRMYRWFNEVGYSANIPALRQLHPQMKTLEQFVQTAESGWMRPAAGQGDQGAGVNVQPSA